MQTTTRTLVVMVALASALAWAEDPKPQISLYMGGQKVLTFKGIQRVAIGDDEICDLKTIGNEQLLLIGLSPGRTTLIVWTTKGVRTEYAVVVTKDPTSDAGEAEEQRVEVAVGEMKVLDFKAIERIAVGNPDVADVRVTETEVLLTGTAGGTTSLVVWLQGGKRETYRVVVTGTARAQAAESAIAAGWTLEVGATREIARPAKVGISDWDVCHLEDTPKSIVLRGHTVGIAEVTVTSADGQRTKHAVMVVPAAPPKR